ncbi:MAG: hypothetical protein K0S08_1645 [Gammaproteobacteria bacterium]|jgi:hypothetical protein|nr:hypothetical protein [Gammaproteobacteria bacterium]
MGRRGTNKPRFRRVSSSPSLVDFLNGRWGSDTVDSRDASYLVGYKLMLERLAYHPDNEKKLATVLPQLENAAHELEKKVGEIIKVNFFTQRRIEKQIEKIAKFYDELLTLAVSHEKGFEELKHHYQRFYAYINQKITPKNPQLARQLLGAYKEAYEKILKARKSIDGDLKKPCANYAEYLHVKRYQESVLKPGQEALNKQSKLVEEALAKFSAAPVWEKGVHKLDPREYIVPPAPGGASQQTSINLKRIDDIFDAFSRELQSIKTLQLDKQLRSVTEIQADAIFIYNKYFGADTAAASLIRDVEAYQKYHAQMPGSEPLKPATLALFNDVKKFRDDAYKYCGVNLLDQKVEEKTFGLVERAHIHQAMVQIQEKVAALQEKKDLGEIGRYILSIQNDPPFKKLLTSRFPVGSSDETLQKAVAGYLAQSSSNAFDANSNPNITVSSAAVQTEIQRCQYALVTAKNYKECADSYTRYFAQKGEEISPAQRFIQQVEAYEQKLAHNQNLPKLDPAILGLYHQVRGYRDAIFNLYLSKGEFTNGFNKDKKVVVNQKNSPRVGVAFEELIRGVQNLQGILSQSDAGKAIDEYQAAFGPEGRLGKFINTVSEAKKQLTAGQSITPEIEDSYNRLIKFRDGIAQYYQVNRLTPSSLPSLPSPASAPADINPFKVSPKLQALDHTINQQLTSEAAEKDKIESIQSAIKQASDNPTISALLSQAHPSGSPEEAYQKEVRDYFASLYQRFTPSAPVTHPLGKLAQNAEVKKYQEKASQLAKGFKKNMDKLYQDLKDGTVSSTEFKKTSEWLVSEHEKQVKTLGEEFESKFDDIAKDTAQYGDTGKEAQGFFNKSQEALLNQSTQYVQAVKDNIQKADEEQKSRERRRLFLIMTQPELFPATDEKARQRIEEAIDKLKDDYLSQLDKYNDIRLGPGTQIKMHYTPGNEMDREGHWNPGEYEILVSDDSPESMAALDLAIDLILERKRRNGTAEKDLKINLSKIGTNQASALRLIQRLEARGIQYEITDPKYKAGPKRTALLDAVAVGVNREKVKTETGDYLKALARVTRQQDDKVNKEGQITTRHGVTIKIPEIPSNAKPEDLREARKRRESLEATAAVIAAHYPPDGGQDNMMDFFKSLVKINMDLQRKCGMNLQQLRAEVFSLNKMGPEGRKKQGVTEDRFQELKAFLEQAKENIKSLNFTDSCKERLKNLEKMDLLGAGAVGFDKPENVDDYAIMLREKIDEYLKLSCAISSLGIEASVSLSLRNVAVSLLRDVNELEGLCRKAGRDPDKLMNAYLGKSSSELKDGLSKALTVVGRIIASPLLLLEGVISGINALTSGIKSKLTNDTSFPEEAPAIPLPSSLIFSPLSQAEPDAALSRFSRATGARAEETEEQLAEQKMRLKIYGELLEETSKADLTQHLNDLCQQLHQLAPITMPMLMTAIHEGKVPAFAALLLTQNPETGLYYSLSDGQVLARAAQLEQHEGGANAAGTLAWAREAYVTANSDVIAAILDRKAPKVSFPTNYVYPRDKSLRENIQQVGKTLAEAKQTLRKLEDEAKASGLTEREIEQLPEIKQAESAVERQEAIKEALYALRRKISFAPLANKSATGPQVISDLLTTSQFEAYCNMKEDQGQAQKLTNITSAARANLQTVQDAQVQSGPTDPDRGPMQIYSSHLHQKIEEIKARFNWLQKKSEKANQQAEITVYAEALREQLSLRVPTVLDRACHQASGYGPTEETMHLVRKETLDVLLNSKSIGFNQKIYGSLTQQDVETLDRYKPQAVHFTHSLRKTVEELQRFGQEFSLNLTSPEERNNFSQCFAEILRERVLEIFEKKEQLLGQAHADQDIFLAWRDALHLLAEKDNSLPAPTTPFDAENAVEKVIKADNPLGSLSRLESKFIERLQEIKTINGQIPKQMVANLDAADCDEALADLNSFIKKNIDAACEHVTGAPCKFKIEVGNETQYKQRVALKILERSQDQLHYLRGSTARDFTAPATMLQQRLLARLESQLVRDVNILNITVPYGLDLSFKDEVNFSQSTELLTRFVEKLKAVEESYQKLARELGVDEEIFAPIIQAHVAKQMQSLRDCLEDKAQAKPPKLEAEKIFEAFKDAGLPKLCTTQALSDLIPGQVVAAMVVRAKIIYSSGSPEELLKQLERIDILQVRGQRSRSFFQLKQLGDEKIGKDDFIAGMLEFNRIVQSVSQKLQKLQQLIPSDDLVKQGEIQKIQTQVKTYIEEQVSQLYKHLKGKNKVGEVLTEAASSPDGSMTPEKLDALVEDICFQLQQDDQSVSLREYQPLSK